MSEISDFLTFIIDDYVLEIINNFVNKQLNKNIFVMKIWSTCNECYRLTNSGINCKICIAHIFYTKYHIIYLFECIKRKHLNVPFNIL